LLQHSSFAANHLISISPCYSTQVFPTQVFKIPLFVVALISMFLSACVAQPTGQCSSRERNRINCLHNFCQLASSASQSLGPSAFCLLSLDLRRVIYPVCLLLAHRL